MREQRSSTKMIAALIGLAALGAGCGDDDGGGGAAGSGSVEDWCAAMDLSDEGDALFESIPTASREDLEAGLQRVGEIVSELESAAPPAIAADVTFLSDYTANLVDALVAADYQIFDVDLSALDVDRLDEVQANLDRFTLDECGRTFGSDDDTADPGDDGSGDDSTFDPAAGTIREQLVNQFVSIGLTQEEAECMADKVDPTDEAVLSGDQAAVFALFEACGIPLSRLEELGG